MSAADSVEAEVNVAIFSSMHCKKAQYPDEYRGSCFQFTVFDDPHEVLTTLAHEEMQAISSIVSDDCGEGVFFVDPKYFMKNMIDVFFDLLGGQHG